MTVTPFAHTALSTTNGGIYGVNFTIYGGTNYNATAYIISGYIAINIGFILIGTGFWGANNFVRFSNDWNWGSWYDPEVGIWYPIQTATLFCVIRANTTQGLGDEITKNHYVVCDIHCLYGTTLVKKSATAGLPVINLHPFQINGYSTMATVYFATNTYRGYRNSTYTLPIITNIRYELNDGFGYSDTQGRLIQSINLDTYTYNDWHNVGRFSWIDNFKCLDSFNVIQRGTRGFKYLNNPQYNVIINGTSLNYSNLLSVSRISKNVSHWSGDIEVGNVEICLMERERIYPWNILFLQYRNIASVSNIRFDINVTSQPAGTYKLFSGFISRVSYSYATLMLECVDNLFGIDSRVLLYDYVPVYDSTDRRVLEKYGYVNFIFGTQVYIDDYNTVNIIDRTYGKTTIWQTLKSAIPTAIITYLYSKSIPAGIGAGVFTAITNLPKSGYTDSYQVVTDWNVVPEDIVNGKQKVLFLSTYSTFFRGKDLVNTYGSIFEYTINSGTFIRGIFGTLDLDTTIGINIGDYVYIKTPITYSGIVSDVIKTILCGSNIDVPYGTEYIDENINKKLSYLDSFTITRIVSPDEGVSPYELIKEICNDIGITFYVNEEGKFTTDSTIPLLTYVANRHRNITPIEEGKDTIGRFNYEVNIESCINKVIYNYYWSGNEDIGYNGKIEVYGSYNVGTTLEINSKWVDDYNLAYITALRFLNRSKAGINYISFQLPYYYINLNIGDLLLLTPKYSLDSYYSDFVYFNYIKKYICAVTNYTKNLNENTIDLTCIDLTSLLFPNTVFKDQYIDYNVSYDSYVIRNKVNYEFYMSRVMSYGTVSFNDVIVATLFTSVKYDENTIRITNTEISSGILYSGKPKYLLIVDDINHSYEFMYINSVEPVWLFQPSRMVWDLKVERGLFNSSVKDWNVTTRVLITDIAGSSVYDTIINPNLEYLQNNFKFYNEKLFNPIFA